MAKPKTKTTVDSPVTPALDDPLAEGPPSDGSAGRSWAPTTSRSPPARSCAAGRMRRRARCQTLRQHAQGSHDRLGADRRAAGSPTRSRPSSTRTGARTSTARRSSPRSSRSAAATWRSTGTTSRVRAGSMDATNGRKLANLIYLAGERGIPLHRHERQRRRLRAGRHRRPRRLRRGVHGAAQDQRRRAEHHVHVRLQRRRRLLSAAPGQLHDPARRTRSSASPARASSRACSART